MVTEVLETVVLPEVYPDVLELQVTHDDIANGKRGDAHHCAVALAARRRFDGARTVAVGGNTVHVRASGPDDDIEYRDPKGWLGMWVARFDQYLVIPPDPGTFRLVKVKKEV